MWAPTSCSWCLLLCLSAMTDSCPSGTASQSSLFCPSVMLAIVFYDIAKKKKRIYYRDLSCRITTKKNSKHIVAKTCHTFITDEASLFHMRQGLWQPGVLFLLSFLEIYYCDDPNGVEASLMLSKHLTHDLNLQHLSYYIAQVVLEFAILLPQPPKC